jgi:hypothetical protein
MSARLNVERQCESEDAEASATPRQCHLPLLLMAAKKHGHVCLREIRSKA